MSQPYLDEAGVGTLSSLMKKEVKDAVFNVTYSGDSSSTIACDKTYEEMLAAHNAGKRIYATFAKNRDDIYRAQTFYLTLNSYPMFVTTFDHTSDGYWIVRHLQKNINFEAKGYGVSYKGISTNYLYANSWDADTHTQTINSYAVSASAFWQTVSIIPYEDGTSPALYYKNGIGVTAVADGKITFTAYTIPTQNIEILVQTLE